MTNWVKVGTDVGTGAVAGILDQVIQTKDNERMVASIKKDPTKPMQMMQQYGTYFNYGLPILTIVGVAMNYLKGDWATRAAVVAGQLAGRKGTHAFQNKKSVTVAPWIRASGSGGASSNTGSILAF